MVGQLQVGVYRELRDKITHDVCHITDFEPLIYVTPSNGLSHRCHIYSTFASPFFGTAVPYCIQVHTRTVHLSIYVTSTMSTWPHLRSEFTSQLQLSVTLSRKSR